MSQQSGSGGRVERGAAEEASGTPLTPTEVDNSRRAPSEARPERAGDDPIVVDDASGMGGGASGGSGGGSGLPGHPDAAG